MTTLMALVVETLEGIKAEHITLIDVREFPTVTDFLVIATGNSNRHVKAIAERLTTQVKEHAIQPLGVEGAEDGEWVLVDLGYIVVHIMQAKTREFYSLEKLWSKKPTRSSSVKITA